MATDSTLSRGWDEYRRFIGAAFETDRRLTLLTAATVVLAGLAPLAAAAAVGGVVGRIPDVIESGLDSPAGTSALLWAGASGGLFFLQWAFGAAQMTTSTVLSERIDFALQRRLMAAVMAPPGIAHLEDPRRMALISVGRDSFRQWLRPGRVAINLGALLAARFVLFGGCLILAAFHPLAAVALLAAGLWAEAEGRNASRREAQHHYGESELARRTEYFYELGVTPAAAKEVRVFGLPSYLLAAYAGMWKRSMGSVFAQTGNRELIATVVLAAVALSILAWVCIEALDGGIALGATTVYAQAIIVSLGGVSAAATAGLQTELGLATFERYHQAVGAVTPPADAGGSQAAHMPAAGLPRREIRFEDVDFRYPGTDRDVLRGLNLTIPAGRSLAIVGANGAGKTSLVKLLCALYEPTSGRILIDGTDLAQVDPAHWRRRIAAVFQDYVQYELPARTNVAFGFAEAQDDLEGIDAAAEAAAATAIVARLPDGWDTVLSTNYKGGVDLSGGEWQKVGLARALFAVRHGAGLLVLDEPAANLDARAEAQLYERFLALTQGITTIVISHRFSTVRQASSIAVIRDGSVAEQGNHEELVALGGTYAEMFRLQASRFEDPAEEAAVQS